MCFFFFKQKTAYEMRISDWSSDVCSSDLFGADVLRRLADARFERAQCRLLRRLVAEIGGRHEAFVILGRELGVDRQPARTLVVPPRQPRSEERRVGKAGVSTCRSRWSPCLSKQTTFKTGR